MKLSCLSSGVEPASVIPLKMVDSILLGLLISVLTPLMASGEVPLEPLCGWPHYAGTSVLIMCAGILDVSPCQICLV